MTRPLLTLLVLLVACGPLSPMVYDHDVPNLAQVDEGVWRSGQITTRKGWEYVQFITNAKRLHVIKLNFSDEGIDGDAIAESMGIDVRRIPIQPAGDQGAWQDIINVFTKPDVNSIATAEYYLEDASPSDVWLVHCTHGQDRTGVVIGEHRVLHDGWSRQKAYAEMRAHNFHPELVGLMSVWGSFK